MVQVSLWTFYDAHLDIDRVTIDIHFYWLDVREYVTIVVIVVTSSIVVFF